MGIPCLASVAIGLQGCGIHLKLRCQILEELGRSRLQRRGAKTEITYRTKQEGHAQALRSCPMKVNMRKSLLRQGKVGAHIPVRHALRKSRQTFTYSGCDEALCSAFIGITGLH
jgi:hypothetical protein